MKVGGSFKSWKKRLCILHSGRLYYYVKKTDTVPKGMISVTGLLCDRVDGLVNGRPYGLKIISPHRTYYVCAKNDEKANQWCMYYSYIYNYSSTNLLKSEGNQ
jgi:hypothetical protein